MPRAVFPDSQSKTSGATSYLLCRVDDALMAVPISQLDEVVPAVSTVPLPDSPYWIVGLLNLRGHVMPVVDLVARMRGTHHPMAVSDLIAVSCVKPHFGMVVSQVHGVFDVLETSIGSAPPVGVAPFIVGSLTASLGVALIVDMRILAALLNPPLTNTEARHADV
jgi:purine-binding chemotaxis protein CheW